MIMVYGAQFMDIGKIAIMIRDPSLVPTWGVGGFFGTGHMENFELLI